MSAERSEPRRHDQDPGNRFETAVRGYDKHQVEYHIARLEQQLSTAQAELANVRRQLAAAREDSVALSRGLRRKPAHEEVGLRMAEILRRAREEAEQERDKASQLAAGIRELAQAQAREVIDEARANAAQLTRDARRAREDELADACAMAEREIETTHRQAETVLAQARERSRRVLADADQRSLRIAALQSGRLSAVLGTYQDAARELDGASRLIDESLERAREQGDPAAQVDPEVPPTLGPATYSEPTDAEKC
jgi:cell division septum initiation protein DivIVA